MRPAVSGVESCREVCPSGRAAIRMPACPLNAHGSGKHDQYDHQPDAGEQREVPDRNETVVVGLIHAALPGMQMTPLNEVSEGRRRLFIVLKDEIAMSVLCLRHVD